MAAYIGNKRFQLTTALNGLGGSSVDKKKYGVGIDDLLGDVHNGKYCIPQASSFKLDFSGISAIEDDSLSYKFAYTNVTDVDLRNLEYSGTISS